MNISIDQEVADLLKKNAEPFIDEPNDVLRRLLGMGPNKIEVLKIDDPTAPKALVQTLQVIDLIKQHEIERPKATRIVANHHGVTIHTVMDKYCRQLNLLSISRFDRMLNEKGLGKLKNKLHEQYPDHTKLINSVLNFN